MRACLLVRHGKPGEFEVRELPNLSPGPNEVVVRVEACGINRLDLWTEEGALPVPVPIPLIQGCEPSGRIISVGPEVRGWKVGDSVAIQSNLFCGRCEFCLSGEESLCIRGRLLGVQESGAFAEQVVVPASSLVSLPDGVSFIESAALTLAGSTAMHMLTQQTSVRAGSIVLVVGGTSGVGSAAIQIARCLGARVFALASTALKREQSQKLGAEAVFDSTDPEWPRLVRESSGRRGVDLVVEHVGGDVLQRCFECLARNGTIVTCGATAGRQIQLNIWPLFVKQQRLVGSYGRTRRDIEKVLAWAAEGRIRPLLDSTVSLEMVPSSLERLRQGLVVGKVVVIPASPGN